MNHSLSILIITYNRPADLLELLKDIGNQQGMDSILREILILNNASTEDYSQVTTFIATQPQLKISYIESAENLGVARGRNRLMARATGDLLLSLDDDMVFTDPNDIVRLSGLFAKPLFQDANTGIITFGVVYYDTRTVQITAFPHKKYEQYKSRPQFLTAYFAGGAHIMKREVVEKAGLYPEDFHYGMEEYDLSYRTLNAGFTIGYDGSVTVAHKESPLGRQANYKKLQMQWVNKSKVAWRYLPLKYFITTATAWAIQYLKNALSHPLAFLSGLVQVAGIPFTEKRHTVSKTTLTYLKKVEARLKF